MTSCTWGWYIIFFSTSQLAIINDKLSCSAQEISHSGHSSGDVQHACCEWGKIFWVSTWWSHAFLWRLISISIAILWLRSHVGYHYFREIGLLYVLYVLYMSSINCRSFSQIYNLNLYVHNLAFIYSIYLEVKDSIWSKIVKYWQLISL